MQNDVYSDIANATINFVSAFEKYNMKPPIKVFIPYETAHYLWVKSNGFIPNFAFTIVDVQFETVGNPRSNTQYLEDELKNQYKDTDIEVIGVRKDNEHYIIIVFIDNKVFTVHHNNVKLEEVITKLQLLT